MPVNVAREVAALQRMTPKQLREKYAQVFGEATTTGNRTWLVRRLGPAELPRRPDRPPADEEHLVRVPGPEVRGGEWVGPEDGLVGGAADDRHRLARRRRVGPRPRPEDVLVGGQIPGRPGGVD